MMRAKERKPTRAPSRQGEARVAADREAPTAKTLARRRLSLLLEAHDPALGAQAIVAGARLGIEVRIGEGGRPLWLDPAGTLSHALRVEAVRVVAEGRAQRGARAFAFAAQLSARARRALEAHIDRKDDRQRTEAGVRADRASIEDGSAVLLREDDAGAIALVMHGHAPIDLGEPPDADAAIREARARGNPTASTALGDVALPPGAEERARAIVFGPRRTLSEPSSRRVLEAFGVDPARWQLAENAARAAASARLVGYPIDLRIASPDASAIDDATLSAIALRTPGEVREGYRALTAEGRRRVPAARVLGVIVSRHVATTPRLRVSIEHVGARASTRELPMSMTIALDDPVGSKLTRPLSFPLPLDRAGAAAALARFEGRGVLPAADTPRADALVELLLRLSQAVRVLGDVVERLDLVPVAPRVDDPGWLVAGARLRVLGVEVT